MLYQLLGGLPPYSDEENRDQSRSIVELILADQPTPVRVRNPFVSRDLAAICEKAMMRAKSERYESMELLRQDLENALQLIPVNARKPGLFLIVQRWAMRNFGSVVAGGLLLAASSVSYYLYRAQTAAQQVKAITFR